MNPKNKAHQQHKNQIRIIGGQFSGRKISFVSAEGLRPTPDSVREKLFNWLGQDLTGQSVLDLFAGSGALGLEALSRHAQQVVFCEKNTTTAQQLRKQIQQLNTTQHVQVLEQDALNYLAQSTQKFDVIFLDPPFAWQNWTMLFESLLPRLHADTAIYLEASILPNIPSMLNIHRQGRAGKSQFCLLYPMTQQFE